MDKTKRYLSLILAISTSIVTIAGALTCLIDSLNDFKNLPDKNDN